MVDRKPEKASAVWARQTSVLLVKRERKSKVNIYIVCRGMLEKESRMDETDSFNFAPSRDSRYVTRIPENGVDSYKL